MIFTSRFEELNKIFESVDLDIKTTIAPLITEIVFLENKMAELRKLPFMRINPNDVSQQKTTPAAKLYKECSQSYMNAIRILCSILNKVDNSAENELLKKLSEFNL